MALDVHEGAYVQWRERQDIERTAPCEIRRADVDMVEHDYKLTATILPQAASGSNAKGSPRSSPVGWRRAHQLSSQLAREWPRWNRPDGSERVRTALQDRVKSFQQYFWTT